MADDTKFVTGEWIEATQTSGDLVKGQRYYVWQSDPLNGIARLSTQHGGAYSLPGSFTFGYLDRATKKVT